MTPIQLSPDLDLLTQEYVLVQAWKKTASYIRYHNWYSDTLALDLAAVDLPRFLGDLSERLESPESWTNDPLRMVPAPKSQEWRVAHRSGWGPVNTKKAAGKLRPLAHVSLKDQVAATAVMLCLADRMETLQGDPRRSAVAGERKRVVSYGNRLFCDNWKGQLRHRWGSGKLYRAYYQDYRTFLSRPAIVGDEAIRCGHDAVLVVHSDLRQFFDRVRPGLIQDCLETHRLKKDDSRFYKLARRLLHWEWDGADEKLVADYKRHAQLESFGAVSLPQGLVAAGFFSNVALLDFDEQLKSAIRTAIDPQITLLDVCRYVDDLRLVISIRDKDSLRRVQTVVTNWIQNALDKSAHGLRVSEDKTKVAAFRGDERALVRQSRKMARIQSAVSGGFDAIAGEEILDAIQGLVRAQQRFSEDSRSNDGWSMSPVPDVGDATVARFAAARFRTTFRSLRPLLPDGSVTVSPDERANRPGPIGRTRVSHTRGGLDEDARSFALGLIEQWVLDPSNVRLLRIGLDIWPASDVLTNVLEHLHSRTMKRDPAARLVAFYCLSELFRAGATETGLVKDEESLPEGVDLAQYRKTLHEAATRLLGSSNRPIPWYLQQQALLFVAAYGKAVNEVRVRHGLKENYHYRRLLRILGGQAMRAPKEAVAALAVVARHSFLGQAEAISVLRPTLTNDVIGAIAARDPAFASEIISTYSMAAKHISRNAQLDLCLRNSVQQSKWRSLADITLMSGPEGPLRNELQLAQFASLFLGALSDLRYSGPIRPGEVYLDVDESSGGFELRRVRIQPDRDAARGSTYQPPEWCTVDDEWRFQLGFLLRFILTGSRDFTAAVPASGRREPKQFYRPSRCHWLQRIYAFFNGHSGFGDDWLPISDWTENLLSSLLAWPGCVPREMDGLLEQGLAATESAVDDYVQEMIASRARANGILVLPVRAPRLIASSAMRPLRACIVQSVVPGPTDFGIADLTLSKPTIRRKHRNHLAAALAAVEQMLALRETHKEQDNRLDWLILPELSVHPDDVERHLIPFARNHKTIILAGLVYEAVVAGQPLVNTAIWIVPRRTPGYGLQVIRRRQGKQHLAALEKDFNSGTTRVRGFRPCQWVVGYEWSNDPNSGMLQLTASVCYDATDLKLVSALRDRSDVFAVPALNADFKTFDHMAQALHYHMYQMVVVANNGLYGGSNAYAPYKEDFLKQVFHLHGQPQASIAFLEIDDVQGFISRRASGIAQSKSAKGDGKNEREYRWKYPPAGSGE